MKHACAAFSRGGSHPMRPDKENYFQQRPIVVSHVPGLWLGKVCVMPEKIAGKKERTVIFEIRTTAPLPVGQQVFIAGDTERLGHWKPDGLPLTRMGENLWSGTALLPAGDTIEFKVTRGSWDTEEVQTDGRPLMNSELKPGGTITIRRTAQAWKDQATA